MKRTMNNLYKDSKGAIVVEATILLPIIMMVVAGLFLLAMYLPSRALLQRATQYAAYGIATEKSDSCIIFSTDGYTGATQYSNVYGEMFSMDLDSDEALAVVKSFCENSLMVDFEGLTVECGVANYVIYKEVFVTATHTIKSPVNLSFVGFPEEITMTVTSTAVVQNGDEFVRNMDVAADFVDYLADKMGIDLGAAMGKVKEVMNWINNK